MSSSSVPTSCRTSRFSSSFSSVITSHFSPTSGTSLFALSLSVIPSRFSTTSHFSLSFSSVITWTRFSPTSVCLSVIPSRFSTTSHFSSVITSRFSPTSLFSLSLLVIPSHFSTTLPFPTSSSVSFPSDSDSSCFSASFSSVIPSLFQTSSATSRFSLDTLSDSDDISIISTPWFLPFCTWTLTS